MTVCVGVVVNDCLVFAADSASSLVQTDEAGQSTIVNVYQHGDKVYNLHRRLPVVAMTCGMGNIGNSSISTLAKELRNKLMGDDPQWRVQQNAYTMEEIATKARRLLYEVRYKELAPEPAAPHSLEFWIGGYSSDPELDPEVWKIDITNGACAVQQQFQGTPAVFWGGQTAAIHRLVIGFDAGAIGVLMRNGVDEAVAQQTAQLLRAELQSPLVNPSMPVRDAIDLADFLTETTKRYFRFLPGADIVGGETDIAVVTKYEGFKWIRRKHFYPASLNPREVDHV